MHRLQEHVIFTGMVEHEEAIGIQQSGNIHIISVRFMNSGAVIVESWAGGIPVIQRDAAAPWRVETDVNGFLFKSKDIDALASCLLKTYANRPNPPCPGG